MARTYRFEVVLKGEFQHPGNGDAADERAVQTGHDIRGDLAATMARLGVGYETLDVQVQRGRGTVVFEHGEGEDSCLA